MIARTAWPLLALVFAAPIACSSSSNGGSGFDSDSGGGDQGGGGGGNGNDGGTTPSLGGGSSDGSASDAAPASDTLTITLRDFKLYAASDSTTNPDFENVPNTDGNGNPSPGFLGPWPDTAIVTNVLGTDGKPIYGAGTGPAGGPLTTHGKAAFDQWYRDTPGTNLRVDYPIHLTKAADGTYGYDSNVSGVPFAPGSPDKMFFPIDDGTKYATAFGDQGDSHNYSFTAEAHTVFTYRGGETFHYRGDDDVFVYVNAKLVINLGGIHDPETGDVSLDALGLTVGQNYPLDFFFAERHKGGSNFLFTTTLELRPSPIVY